MLRSKSFLALALTSCLLLLGGTAQAAEQLDDFEDLAGLLTKDSSDQNVLYAMEGHTEEVLSALGAKPTGDGKTYEAVVDRATVRFQLAPVAYPAFFIQLVCATSSVRVYRNATCVQTQAASLSPCFPFLYPTYARFQQNAVRKCQPGIGYCVEHNQAYQFRRNYSNSACSGLYSVTTLSYAFIC